MTSAKTIPIPPLELRQVVGPTDPAHFDNPTGQPIYTAFGLPLDAYDSVFDFGCGCGRLARQLLQQEPRPGRYVGVDVHRELIDWCRQNLSPFDPNFLFYHHDVYSPSYAPGNSLQLARPFPVQDGEVSLLIANSVFTHLLRRQTEYYLREVARVLKPQGVAVTTWFFFDRDSFPFLHQGPFTLFTGEADPTQAVIYDRKWFVETLRRCGLGVTSNTPPLVAGHQWSILLAKRTPEMVDRFPLGEEGAEWICGATLKPIAAPAVPPEAIEEAKVESSDAPSASEWPQPPALYGPLAELAAMRQSRAWRVGRAVTEPFKTLRGFLRR